MNLTPDRQGYLGDLETKSLPQLKELLERQEKLLHKPKLISSFPDKGERIKKLIENVKYLIELKSWHPPVASSEFPRLEQLKTNSHHPSDFVRLRDDSSDFIDDQTALTLQAVSTRDEQNVRIEQEDEGSQKLAEDISVGDEEDSQCSLSSTLQKLSIGSVKENTAPSSNSYERVIKKADVKTSGKQKFLPHRTTKGGHTILHSHHGQEKTKKHAETEESAVYPPKYKFQESKLISIEDSIKLIEEQRAKNEELVAERAAKRLAEQLTPKMDLYSPQHVDMQYRDPGINLQEGRDSDDDDDEELNDDY